MRHILFLGILLVANVALAQRPHSSVPASVPWWQKETAMSGEGKLTLVNKTWWSRALALQDGQRFTLDLNGDGKPDTIVAREGMDIVEAIDDTGRAADIWNHVSTTYVVSFNGSGTVDRMVSYIDSGNRGKADEIEIRYFADGYLRYAWFGKSYGGDAATIFAMKHWQYAGNDKGSAFRGNSQIYINKYDPQSGGWQPLSECPFSFWDLDGDGRTDVTLRVSAAPAGSLHGPDTDYANNYDYMWAKEATPLAKVAATNMRLSFNIDGPSRTDPVDRPHSNFSFTMTGNQPYNYPGMEDFNAARRFPQTTIHMPWSAKWVAALRYQTSSIGFTWDEARSNFRWEGQFWIYERAYLSNTGSPTQRWNMRREFSGQMQNGPHLYFSPADERFHMRGAQEAWLEAGHLVDNTKDLEFRWWSSTGDGLLDTVEVYRGNEVVPARVARFDPRATDAALDRETLSREYNENVLPSAISTDEGMLRALRSLVTDETARQYEQAASAADSMERRRYCLDIARELLYLRVRDLLLQQEKSSPYSSSPVNTKRFRDPGQGDVVNGYTLGDTLAFWDSVRFLHTMDQEYANGNFPLVQQMLAKVDASGKVPHDSE
jgi:hypothetical protein